MINSIDKKLELLNEKMKIQKQEISDCLKSKKLFEKQYYRNEVALNQINTLSKTILNQKEWKDKKSNLLEVANYIDEKSYSYERINKAIKLSNNFKAKNLSNLIKDAAIYQLNLKNGDNGEKETERMIMLFSDKVKYARGIRVGIKDEASGKMIHAENDFIIVCENGIFTLEVKRNSKDRVVTENGNFIDKGSKSKAGNNIVEQCMLHENVVRRVLEEEILNRFSKKENVEVNSVIISANNAINIENKSNRYRVLLKNEIQNYILNEFEPKRKLSEEEIELYFDILKSRDVGEAEFPHNIKIDEIIEQISTYLVIESNYNYINKLLSERKQQLKQIELEEVERKATEERIKEETAKKEAEIKRYNEKRDQKTKKVLRIVGSVTIGIIIVISLKAISSFNKHRANVEYSKNVAVGFKSDIESAISGNNDNLSNIIKNLNNAVEEYEINAFIKLLKEDSELKNKLFKELDRNVTKDRVVNDFISINGNNRITLKESIVNINTNISEVSSSSILKINGENIAFNNTLKLLPGIYDIQALDIVNRAETKNISEVITKDTTIDLLFNNSIAGEIINSNIVTNVDQGQVIINGEESNYFFNNGRVKVSDLIKGDSQISIMCETPWGRMITKSVVVNGLETNIKFGLDDEAINNLNIFNELKEKYRDYASDDEELSLTLYMDDIEFNNIEDEKMSISIWTEFECNYVSFGSVHGVFNYESEIIVSADGEIEDIYITKKTLPKNLNSENKMVIKY